MTTWTTPCDTSSCIQTRTVKGEPVHRPWTADCDTGSCIEHRTVGDQVEIRDTGNPDATLLVPAEAWEKFLAGVRGDDSERKRLTPTPEAWAFAEKQARIHGYLEGAQRTSFAAGWYAARSTFTDGLERGYRKAIADLRDQHAVLKWWQRSHPDTWLNLAVYDSAADYLEAQIEEGSNA